MLPKRDNMPSKSDKLATLQAELTTIETSIANIIQSGQSFSKGDSSGFRVEMANLPELHKRKDIINSKIATWEAS